MAIDAIFFDVGYTLLFPDHEKTLAPLWSRGIRPTDAQLQGAERVARQELDLLIAQSRKIDQQYWETYYGHLLRSLGISEVSLRLELVSLIRTSSNWTRMRPGTADVLEALTEKYRLAVISNSDGRMAQTLASFGLGKYFERVIDSGSVGHEKPAPQIFQAALSALSLTAERSAYVGDIYSVDYLGAEKVGMRAVLMDVNGVYATRNVARIESLNQLQEVVAKL